MDLQTFLRFAKRYSNLGWSVQGQFRAVANGDSMANQNGNALTIIRDFLKDLEDVEGAEELAQDIDEFLTDEELASDIVRAFRAWRIA